MLTQFCGQRLTLDSVVFDYQDDFESVREFKCRQLSFWQVFQGVNGLSLNFVCRRKSFRPLFFAV
jgi:hypothetical protein